MKMSWPAILSAVFVLQIALATFVWYDARRHSLERGSVYWCGTLVPLGGFLVFVIYVAQRDEEPRRERTSPAVDQPELGVAWRVQLPDPLGLPRRLSLAIFALWRRLLLFSVVVSMSLFAGALLLHPRINVGVLELSGVLLVVMFGIASSYRDVVFTVDLDDDELRQEHTGGIIFTGYNQEHVADLQSLDRLRAVPVGQHSVCRLAYEQPLFSLGPPAVVVHRQQTEEVLNAFERADVDTDIAGRYGSIGWLATALVPIGLLPTVGTLATGEAAGRALGLFVVLVVAWLVMQAVAGIRRSMFGWKA